MAAKITDAERQTLEKLDVYLNHLSTYKKAKPVSIHVTYATYCAIQKKLGIEKTDPVTEYKGFKLRVLR